MNKEALIILWSHAAWCKNFSDKEGAFIVRQTGVFSIIYFVSIVSYIVNYDTRKTPRGVWGLGGGERGEQWLEELATTYSPAS